MNRPTLALASLALACLLAPEARAVDPWVVYPGGPGPGQGKNVVLISGDEEYRSEEALPQLAKILAKRHGFTCTVLFAIGQDGAIDPNRSDNIPGLEALRKADLMVIATRFRDLPDDQMKEVVDYVESGRPIIGMRTATHAFNIKAGKTYARYSHNSKEWPGGFGKQVLGETWYNHHGNHGSQSHRGIVAPGAADHPILKGIKDGDIWGPTDVYGVHLPLPGDSKPLVLGQVVVDMTPEGKPLEGPKNDPMMPVAWVKTFQPAEGKSARVFTTTMGAATDLESPGVRRMLVNACYWATGLEEKIPNESDVALVGPYGPHRFGFNGGAKGVRPEWLADQPASTLPERPFLHPLFTDHAVLQRDVPVPFWGWAAPGERVKVAFAGQSVETTVNPQGRWMAKLGPFPAGGPHTLTVTGPKSAEVSDILIGDVWICSGQSNMEWSVRSADRHEEEIAAANYPKLRLFSVPKKTATAPVETVDASWQTCTPDTVPGFSAVGYFFGRHLVKELDVPIGLIHSSWGGTVAEAWTSAGALATLGDFDRQLAQLKAEREEDAGRPAMRPDRAMAAWWKRNDPGSTDQPMWSDPKFDASAWKSMDLPGHWEGKGLDGFDGIVWFRKEFDLPEGAEGKEWTITLGPIDDRDTTFVNGVEVGGMNEWNAPRKYNVPAGVAKAGRNVVAVRVLDTAGQGGFAGSPGDLKLTPSKDGEPVTLAGAWSFKESKPLADLSSPPEPAGSNPNRVTVLYNGMIAPLEPFPIRGATWYQGESNASRAAQYRRLLPTMIRDWRDHFGVGDFPFLVVQLANYQKRQDNPGPSAWAELREAQFLATKALPNVAVASAIDIGEADDIHPTNKQDVGKRLALDALAMTYGKDIESSGPVFKALEIRGNHAVVRFDHLGGGLVARGGGPLEGFAVAGADGQFAWAEAKIEGDAVVVSSPKVENPRYVRYAWADNPACNLYNKADLPAVPFRSDPPLK